MRKILPPPPLFFLIVFIFFIEACTPLEQEQLVDRSDKEYQEKKDSDRDRDTVIARTAKIFGGNKCEDEDKTHDCHEYCDEMFRIRNDRIDCKELTVGQVEAIYSVYKLLENPDEDELEDIDNDVFDLYLNVSIASLDNLIDKYSSSDARKFLSWIISNEDIARIFAKEDDGHKTLWNLLKQFSRKSFTSQTIYKPLLSRLDSSYLMELIITEGYFILEWFHDFIDERNTECNTDKETKSCFAIYCKIGQGLDRETRSDWLDDEEFEEYIEDIISGKVNSQQGTGDNLNAQGWKHEDAAGSDADEIGDIGDIEDWLSDLCQGLTDLSSGSSGSSGSSSSNSNSNDAADNLPVLCSGLNTNSACITKLLSSSETPRSSIDLAKSKEALSWIFADAARAEDFLRRAKAASPKYSPLEKFLHDFVYLRTSGGMMSFNPRSSNIFAAFVVDVKANKNLMELTLDTNTAGYMIDYINGNAVCSNETNRGSGRGVEQDCFRNVHCAIAHYGDLSTSYINKLYKVTEFKTYIDKVILGATEGGSSPDPRLRGIIRHIIRSEVVSADIDYTQDLAETVASGNWKDTLCRLDEL